MASAQSRPLSNMRLVRTSPPPRSTPTTITVPTAWKGWMAARIVIRMRAVSWACWLTL